jgi:hypothetical protein
VSCLKKNEPRLSTACQQRLDADEAKAKRFIEEFGRACREDVTRFCGSVEPGEFRVISCLDQHQSDLAPACQAEIGRIAEARSRASAVRTACQADVDRLCKDVPPHVGPLLECLQANEADLSPGCNAADIRPAVEAASVVDILERATSRERIQESLQILQGLDSVAFSRSQILLQFDSYQALQDKGNGGRMLFNPQFVFGKTGEFALQVKIPVTAVFPYAAGAPTQFGLGAVTTAFAWKFLGSGQVRQFVSIALQMETASSPPLGGPWALIPSYAIGAALAHWLSLTVQVQWVRSISGSGNYPELNLVLVEPILAANLPGRSFLALDTRLGWDFATGTFVPIMKGMAGLFVDRQKSLSVSLWYQATLSQPAANEFYKYGVGMGLAYFFDW